MIDVAIGVDVGGTKTLAFLVTRGRRVLDEVQSPTPHDNAGSLGGPTVNVLTEQNVGLCEYHGLDSSRVPIGVGPLGLLRRDDRLKFAPNLRSASGADVGALLDQALTSSVVFCENGANCAAIAEHEWVAGRGIDDFVMVTLGTGIGGGVIVDGKLVRGRSGFAGEIGHMVVQARGVACSCGGYGCWEHYASGGGLNRLTREATIEGRLSTLVSGRGNAAVVCSEDVTAAAEGLEAVVVLMREVGWWLALGLGNLVAYFYFGHVVIGGGCRARASTLRISSKVTSRTPSSRSLRRCSDRDRVR